MLNRLSRTLELVAAGIIGGVFTSFVAIAWTGPASAPPNGNVAPPINVGTTDQVKNAGLAVNALAVFGNSAFTGDITAAGFFHSSDARLKENIKTVPGIEVVSKLRGAAFTWKKDGAQSAGVIAQEVEPVLPEAVRTGTDGMLSVNYDALVAALIEAVKAQQQEIDALKAAQAR